MFEKYDSEGRLVERGDDATGTVTTYGADGTVSTRPYTRAEAAAAQAQAAEATRATTTEKLHADTSADLDKINQAITDLQILLDDNTTAGSARAWRSTVTNTYSAATLRGVADLIIADARATRRVARQTLRLAKLLVGDLDSADVGSE